MKRALLAICMIGIFSLSYLWGTDEKKKEDPLKKLHKVEKVAPLPQEVKVGFDSISENNIEAYMRFLASDLLEGRNTASKSYEIAAQYGASLFRLWGLQPGGDLDKSGKVKSYLQNVELKEITSLESSLVVQSQKGALRKAISFDEYIDYVYFTRETMELSAPLVFIGYGNNDKNKKVDKLEGIDLKGKIVVLRSLVNSKNKEETKETSKKVNLYTKMATLGGKGAVAVIMAEETGILKMLRDRRDNSKLNDEKPIIPRPKSRKHYALANDPYKERKKRPIFIPAGPGMADRILDLAGTSFQDLVKKYKKERVPQVLNLKGIFITLKKKVKTKIVYSSNVLGFIEGSDPELKKEAVVIGAHLDHLGKRGDYIFNGADDNASGSAGVLSIARAFALNQVKPKRSIVFALWTAEEKGLLGSKYYANKPSFPLEQTYAYLNMDMIGRFWDKERLEEFNKSWRMNIPQVVIDKVEPEKFIIPMLDKSAPQLYEALKDSNRYLGMTFYPMYDTPAGSDHYSFQKKNVPWLHICSSDSDHIHRPHDSIDKMNWKTIQTVARMIYLTAFNLANK